MATEYRFKRPSDGCVFEPVQWNLLCHIFETFIPRLTAEETEELKKDYYQKVKDGVDEKTLEAFAQESVIDRPEFMEDVDSVFQKHVTPEKVAEIKTALNLLNTRLGSLVFTGSTVPLYERTRKEREEIIFGWSTARMSALKKLFKAFGTMAKAFYTRMSPTYHAAVQFPGYPFTKEGEEDFKKTMEAAATAEANPDFHFEDLSRNASVSADGVIQLTTSILVIGSGCGGGVVAGHLSKALPHHSVMVVEKGFWYPKHKQPMTERDGIKALFEEGGSLQTNDGSMVVMAGSTWGGGSTINWGVSWQLSARIRREWSEKFGLNFALSPEFQDCLDFVSHVGQCKPLKDQEHNVSNSAIIKGSHRLGEKCVVMPVNTHGDRDMHNKLCGAFCTIGCRGAGHDSAGGGGKMAVTKSYLLDARENGAKFIQGFDVGRIVFDKAGNAIGVEGTWRSSPDEPEANAKKVFIGAKKIVCSGGTINTPAILLRSGLKNYYIGRNFHAHPALVSITEWDEEVRPWEGHIISAANTENDNLDHDGHGAVIEGMLMLPGFGQISVPWKSGLEYKKRILRYKHFANHVIICRDRDAGRITIDPKSKKPVLDYTPSEFDKAHMLECLIGSMRMNRAAGARSIYVPVIGIPVYERLTDTEADEKAFNDIVATLKKAGLSGDTTAWGCAHQMGTCRMGTSSRKGACNDRGKIWERNGLYVADASLMPASSGVNPMITTQALAEWVSRGIVADIVKEENKNSKL